MQDFCGYSTACGGALFVLAALVFAGPLLDKRIADRLEWFLLAVGAAACTLSWAWSGAVIVEAILRPMRVCAAILVGSLFFSFTNDWIRAWVRGGAAILGVRAAVAAAVVGAGLASPLLTAEVAALVLVEILEAVRLEPEAESHAAVLGCLAIGLGSILTSFGGPVSAVAMAKLVQAPYPIEGHFLLGLVGAWAIPVTVGMGALAGFLYGRPDPNPPARPEDPLSLWQILVLTGKLYIFISALVLLGAGLLPLIDRTLLTASPSALFWGNSLAAVADGATLASVEISPRMQQDQLRYVLLSLSIAGGALIQGNAHNLIVSHRLGIDNRRWARAGVPAAAVLMACCWLSLVVGQQ